MKIRILFLLLPILLAVTSPLWWEPVAEVLRPRTGPVAEIPAGSPASQRFAMEGVYFTRSISGRPDWQITAAILTTTERENELYLERVEAQLQGHSGSRYQVTSGRGLYDTDELVLTLQDRVRIQLDRDHELQTELLHYREKADRVETEAPVRLKGPGLEVQGHGMTFDLATGSYSVGGRLRVLLR